MLITTSKQAGNKTDDTDRQKNQSPKVRRAKTKLKTNLDTTANTVVNSGKKSEMEHKRPGRK